MVRVGPNSGVRFVRTFDLAKYITASVSVKRNQEVPVVMDHSEAHTQVVEGWAGDTYVLPVPVNVIEGDSGQIMLRGHASQTVTFSNLNYGDQLPALPTDDTKMVVISWKAVNGSFVVASTGERDWPY